MLKENETLVLMVGFYTNHFLFVNLFNIYNSKFSSIVNVLLKFQIFWQNSCKFAKINVYLQPNQQNGVKANKFNMLIILFLTIILLCGTFFMYGNGTCTHACDKCYRCSYLDNGFIFPFCRKYGQDPKFCNECNR